jgi:ubiquinone/menaquinone biosynthesis C-methylase UbiE
MNESFNSLLPLIEKKSLLKNTKDFHSIVNVIFHDHEAKSYDTIHDEMWQSLPYQYQLLVDDIKDHIPPQQKLKLLDVGCGTGLATELILNTRLGENINEIHLLDTSSEMLNKAKNRAKTWNKNFKVIHGDIEELADTYDLIIISSVIHHIPDLINFFKIVGRHQKNDAVLLTIHDPAFETVQSNIYRNRCQEYRLHYQQTEKSRRVSLGKRLINKAKRVLKPQNYIEDINRELLKRNIIKTPLTSEELWSVTDIHVEDLPYSASNGISRQLLNDVLPEYSLLSYRTYAFFGTLNSCLTPSYQQKEQELSLKGDLNGRNFGSAWIKNKVIS